MELSSARTLKASILEQLISPLTSARVLSVYGLETQPVSGIDVVQPTIAIGVARHGSEHVLAVRVQRRELMRGQVIDAILNEARREVDVQFIGSVRRLSASMSLRARVRPLVPGVSISHYAVTAGTLGGVVRRIENGDLCLMSNNHVLANENQGELGDPIVQPATYDGGLPPDDVVGHLSRFLRLEKNASNEGDIALATVEDTDSVEGLPDVVTVDGLMMPTDVDDVAKIGRTTGRTNGRITAFELSNLVVGYKLLGNVAFDNQFEVDGNGQVFAGGGDSGALVTTGDGRYAVGIAFAATESGGFDNLGVTFASPTGPIFEMLDVELVS